MQKMSFPHERGRVILAAMTAIDPSRDSRRVFVQRSPGVEISVLRVHPDGGLTFFVRMQQGARAERHGHPGGEETYVVSGQLHLDRRVDAAGEPRPDLVLRAGDHLFAPPGEVHEGIADLDTTLYVIAPGGILRVPAA